MIFKILSRLDGEKKNVMPEEFRGYLGNALK
jgi:hypothetical protein